MSAEQGIAFAKGLVKLTDQFKADAEARTDTFATSLEAAGQQFVDGCHDYAKDMTQLANDLTVQVKELYDATYPEGAPDVGEPGDGGTQPPTGSEPHPEHPIVIPPEGGSGGGGGMWEGKPSDPHPSTGPVGPQPKK